MNYEKKNIHRQKRGRKRIAGKNATITGVNGRVSRHTHSPTQRKTLPPTPPAHTRGRGSGYHNTAESEANDKGAASSDI